MIDNVINGFNKHSNDVSDKISSSCEQILTSDKSVYEDEQNLYFNIENQKFNNTKDFDFSFKKTKFNDDFDNQSGWDTNFSSTKMLKLSTFNNKENLDIKIDGKKNSDKAKIETAWKYSTQVTDKEEKQSIWCPQQNFAPKPNFDPTEISTKIEPTYNIFKEASKIKPQYHDTREKPHFMNLKNNIVESSKTDQKLESKLIIDQNHNCFRSSRNQNHSDYYQSLSKDSKLGNKDSSKNNFTRSKEKNLEIETSKKNDLMLKNSSKNFKISSPKTPANLKYRKKTDELKLQLLSKMVSVKKDSNLNKNQENINIINCSDVNLEKIENREEILTNSTKINEGVISNIFDEHKKKFLNGQLDSGTNTIINNLATSKNSFSNQIIDITENIKKGDTKNFNQDDTISKITNKHQKFQLVQNYSKSGLYSSFLNHNNLNYEKPTDSQEISECMLKNDSLNKKTFNKSKSGSSQQCFPLFDKNASNFQDIESKMIENCKNFNQNSTFLRNHSFKFKLPKSKVCESFANSNKKKVSAEITKMSIKNLNRKITRTRAFENVSKNKIILEKNSRSESKDDIEYDYVNPNGNFSSNHTNLNKRAIFGNVQQYYDILGKKHLEVSEFQNEYSVSKKSQPPEEHYSNLFEVNNDNIKINKLNSKIKNRTFKIPLEKNNHIKNINKGTINSQESFLNKDLSNFKSFYMKKHYNDYEIIHEEKRKGSYSRNSNQSYEKNSENNLSLKNPICNKSLAHLSLYKSSCDIPQQHSRSTSKNFVFSSKKQL